MFAFGTIVEAACEIPVDHKHTVWQSIEEEFPSSPDPGIPRVGKGTPGRIESVLPLGKLKVAFSGDCVSARLVDAIEVKRVDATAAGG